MTKLLTDRVRERESAGKLPRGEQSFVAAASSSSSSLGLPQQLNKDVDDGVVARHRFSRSLTVFQREKREKRAGRFHFPVAFFARISKD